METFPFQSFRSHPALSSVENQEPLSPVAMVLHCLRPVTWPRDVRVHWRSVCHDDSKVLLLPSRIRMNFEGELFFFRFQLKPQFLDTHRRVVDKHRRRHRWYVVALMVDSHPKLTLLHSVHRVRPTGDVNTVCTRTDLDPHAVCFCFTTFAGERPVTKVRHLYLSVDPLLGSRC